MRSLMLIHMFTHRESQTETFHFSYTDDLRFAGEALISKLDGLGSDGSTIEDVFMFGGRGISIHDSTSLEIRTALVDNLERVSAQFFRNVFNTAMVSSSNTPQQDRETTSPSTVCRRGRNLPTTTFHHSRPLRKDRLQQHRDDNASAHWQKRLFLSNMEWSLFVGYFTSQQDDSVSQGRICSDKCSCCHTEREVTGQPIYLTQSPYTDSGLTSPSADPLTPSAWQCSHWRTNF